MNNKSSVILLSLALLIPLSCGSHRKNIQKLTAEKNYEQMWALTVKHLQENPLNKEANASFLGDLDVILNHIRPGGDTMTDISEIERLKLNSEKNTRLFGIVKGDFDKMYKIYVMNESRIKGDWYAVIRVEYDEKNRRIADYASVVNYSETRLSSMITSHDNMARRLYRTGLNNRDKKNYPMSKTNFALAKRYNTKYEESANMIIGAMKMHETAESRLKEDKNSREAEDILREAISLDPTNKNIEKSISSFINNYLSNVRICENGGFFGAAALEYLQILRFASARNDKTHMNKYAYLIKKARSAPILSVALIARDNGPEARNSERFSVEIEKGFRKNAASYLQVKNNGYVNALRNASSETPKFSGVDIGIGMSVTINRIDPLVEEANPKTQQFVFCKNCESAPNPKIAEIQKQIAGLQSDIASLEAVHDSADILSSMGGMGKWGNVLKVAKTVDRVAIAAKKSALQNKIIELQTTPPTIMVDKIETAMWDETVKTQNAVVEIKFDFFTPGKGSIHSFTSSGTGTHRDVTIIPGQYADRVNIKAKSALLKPDNELQKTAIANAINNSINDLMSQFDMNSGIDKYVSGNIPDDISKPQSRYMAIDYIVRLLMTAPNCSRSSEMKNRLSEIVRGYDYKEIIK
jgi:tetratricopeptide (TPR) repeat protein